MKAILALENAGICNCDGEAAGAPGETGGEVVFNTSLTGWEILTDPSYSGQIVTMTAPEIGNYGVAPMMRSRARRRWPASSSATSRRWRATGVRTARCASTLVRHDIVAISDIDTRALTRVLRSAGVMRGVIATGDRSPQARRKGPGAAADGRHGSGHGSDLRQRVRLDAGAIGRVRAAAQRRAGRPLKVAACDFGMKWNILRRFTAHNCEVACIPPAPASGALATSPDGVFLSNGPGDPAVLDARSTMLVS